MHWVSRPHAVDVTVHRYERLFRSKHPGADGNDPLDDRDPNSRITTLARAEPALGEVAAGDVVQFERLGYFAADLDDPAVFHRTVGLRDEWANIQKQR
jgi:glutaminyl-tRNA synthetase